ncbi:peptidyl-tRNA hydrolase [Leptospira ryugenii]|uniref:Peptidyl-tRNA hydrolase n=1 Tax=Leptospira ryugenii TaxID=1917863 RepID=A0A2P2DYA5_9LEPT|nr:aminoacyl-tRNA hydrolase [Leptospira ryugenii]GBF49625.1 peptidyl-tRNA hydrolase [Leptospira ryugenii]
MEHCLIVGLGNPGKQYRMTRHNIGFLFIDYLVETKSLVWKEQKTYDHCYMDDEGLRIHFLKPKEYMNLSGKAVANITQTYKIKAEHIIVLQDEVDISFGKIKNKIGGGTAGHNGLKDIIQRIGSQDFHRLRLGVDKPPKGTMDVADYVLQNFTKEEETALPAIWKEAESRIQEWIKLQKQIITEK